MLGSPGKRTRTKRDSHKSKLALALKEPLQNACKETNGRLPQEGSLTHTLPGFDGPQKPRVLSVDGPETTAGAQVVLQLPECWPVLSVRAPGAWATETAADPRGPGFGVGKTNSARRGDADFLVGGCGVSG